jgi:aldose 1-epimerase
MSNQSFWGEFHGEKAVWLRAGQYEAAVLPEIGANLIAFRDTENGYRFLREPAEEEMTSFKEFPIVHGIPVLFPPNRYEDGKFPWQGAVYQFPVNEEKTNNHLHGFVHNIPWEVLGFSSNDHESKVTLALKVRPGHSVYAYLPHSFTIKLSYTLNGDGLLQHVLVNNDGDTPLPCLLAFHTTLNAPFIPGSTPDDCRFMMTTGRRYELNERMLPTGRFQPLTAEEELMKTTGLSPFFEPMDNHYTTDPQNGRNRMELTDVRRKVTLVYDAGTAYKHWMIWNNNATPGFFCPEPQMNLVNAPMVDLPAEQIGLLSLAPGEKWEETSRLYVK